MAGNKGYGCGNESPVACLGVDPAKPIVGLSVTFCATGSYDPDGSGGINGIYKFEWDWENDGTYDHIETYPCDGIAAHTFTLAGQKTVKIRVTDGEGARDTTTRTFDVGNVIYVDVDSYPFHDGSTWVRAFVDIQDALDIASNGNEIWVADGTYKPTDETDRTISFKLVEGVSIYGGFEGGSRVGGGETERSQRDWANNETILSGDIDGSGNDDSYNVVVGAAGATLDGFTITKGYADHASTAQYQSGGGMYNSGCSPTVTNCIFDDNYAKYGGGMYNTSSSPTVTDCSFTDNEAVYWGGGMNNTSSSSATITRCIFAGNAVTATDYGGGAIYCESSSNGNIVNCTISKNTAANGYAGGLYSDSSSPTINNTIFWDNTDGDSDYDFYSASSGTITIDYSDVIPSHYFSGTGDVDYSSCISVDPLFADADNDDFHIKSADGRWNGSSWVTDSVTSPCINGGDPTSSNSNEPVPNGSRINMGAYGNTTEASKSSKYHLVVYLDTDDQEAPSSDMKWKLDGFDSTWRNSAEAVLVDADNYTIKCQCNLGTYYIAPDDLGITVGQGEPISYTRTYKACGYICYICYYYNNFGAYEETYAGWRVVGEGGSDWKNGQKKYVPGNYDVEFKSVAEHDTPSNTNITVTKGSTNSGQYKEYQRNTFYVDMEYGSNSNKGGSMNKFLTIQKGFDMVTPKSSGDPDRWIYVESNYSTKYEDITFPLSNRPCFVRSYSNLTIRGDHTPDNKPWYITAIGITFEEW